MRKTLLTSCAAVLTLLAVLALPVAAGAESATWTGWITDENCGAKGASAEHAACARKCHQDGAALVLYTPSDEKTYRLSDQEMAAEHLGHEVMVSGELDGDAIEVSAIEASEGEGDGAHGHEGHGEGHGHGEHGGEGHGR